MASDWTRLRGLSILHVPLSDETRNMINSDVLSAARKGLVLINTARGEVLDIDALHDAMQSAQVAAAGLDVLAEEPANVAKPLLAACQRCRDCCTVRTRWPTG